MDCNSIVYDTYYLLEKDYSLGKLPKYIKREQFEEILIQKTIESIKKHIAYIQPTNLIYIAFDGVAPLAKMSQQRTRRYKSFFNSQIENTPKIWNTVAITPGTLFSKKLSAAVVREFRNKSQLYGVQKIVVSCTDEIGEGEHKLFQHLRENPLYDNEVAVYGLDSDLIMLSIFHRVFCKNIHIFREAPEFMKTIRNIPTHTQNEKILFLDIGEFSTYMFEEIDFMGPSEQNKNRIYDYIFICFFLGNDFLPHFPALNIRSHGIQILLDTFKKLSAEKSGFTFIDLHTNRIIWDNIKRFLSDLASNEHKYIIQEYQERKRWDKQYWKEETEEEKSNILQNIPVIYREHENYINPTIPKWEKRYYQTLFHNTESLDINDVCRNYLEGLEWTFKYYTTGCPDWRWKYNYSYPPLLQDLIRYLRTTNIDEFVPIKPVQPFTSYQQLAYVLPYQYLNLLPMKICERLRKEYSKYYPLKLKFQWAFCRYFWEAHPIINEMDIRILSKI